MNKKTNTKIIKNKKRASSTVYVTVFVVIFLALATFAIDGSIILTNRVKLQNITEMTALAAASEFNYSTDVDATALHVANTANTTFDLLKQNGLEYAKMSPNINATSGKILITSTMTATPYFLAFLGVSGVNLEAKACAVCEELPITANYPGINWLTTKAAYLSDILSSDVNMNDTAILLPLGNMPSASYETGIINFGLINDGDGGDALSLGPGGFITIKLPAPVINKTGADLYIKETGKSIEGYMVFAGLDEDPDNPYVKNGEEGAGIKWINISSAGESDSNLSTQAHQVANTQVSTNTDKFYGSGYFDLSKVEGTTITMIKYIRIIDDNSESAFITNDKTNYYKAMMYGEASTTTAGADIDYIKVLNHVRLIPSKEF